MCERRITVSTHSHTYQRTGFPPSLGGPGRRRPNRLMHRAVLALLLVAAVAALLIATSTADSGADRLDAMREAAQPSTAITLPGGLQGTLRRGIIHAPDRYSPPGPWRSPTGPALR
jgi:hypothetical protein